ncbi:FKBP-type peptidyl-prolyl cis-trans isomerase [Cellulomonas palmilytica]|uniref:FKBP-type peptidyl-prolyl cis-trans isomerase n=1 Tax=Cellulomonas palmilytica TaxID=2608402 RepID=UPI001F189E10|nr:FKBP-type peptidyl-prolyl cis-trans isomerase [Cellulomonas palmilytica]UJP40730.1 FKBP-type peptidyl-prolyl cis-trans isomerase [Cellulomonas palmilytica]
MRRTPHRRLAAAAIAAALALTLAACSDDDSGSAATPTATTTADPAATADPTGPATASAEDVAALEKVKVEGDPGSEPTITLPSTPFSVGAAVARVVTPGDGDAVAEGDTLEIQLTAVNGEDGKVIGSTYQDEATGTWTVSGDGSGIPALDEVLVTTKLGAQVVFALVSGETTQVYVLEPVQKIGSRAEGEAVAPVEGLPTVTLAEDGAPTLTAATGDAPADLVVQPLIQGTGKEVEEGDNILVQYHGALWDGTVFDSSWANGQPFPVTSIGSAQVIDGWNQGLVGTHVGDQVLLVIPPELGYKDQASEKIPANSTLVFVVDVLWAS